MKPYDFSFSKKFIFLLIGLGNLIGQSDAGNLKPKKNTGNGIEMIIKRVRDFKRNSGTKGMYIHIKFMPGMHGPDQTADASWRTWTDSDGGPSCASLV